MATMLWTGGATFTYDEAPTFTYSVHSQQHRPRVGPWRFKRYKRREPGAGCYVLPVLPDFTTTNTLTETEAPSRSSWRRLWAAILGRIEE